MSGDGGGRTKHGGPRPAGARPGGPRPGASRAVRKAIKRGPVYEKPRLVLGSLNYALMGAGVVSVIVGFLFLAQRDISVAPFLLALGYCILIPAGLLVERVPGRGPKGASDASTQGE